MRAEEGAVMRTILALLLLAGTAEAGLYNLTDPLPNYFKRLQDVRIRVKELRAVPREPPKGKKLDPGSPRSLYLQQAERLRALLDGGNISTLERVDLAAAYIRLARPEEALKALEGANQGHF